MRKRIRSPSISSQSTESGSEAQRPPKNTAKWITKNKSKPTKVRNQKGRKPDKSHKSSSSGSHGNRNSSGSESSDSESSASDPGRDKPKAIDKEYAIAARAVARCVDLFCQPRKVVDYIILLKHEESVKKGELDESEGDRKRREQLLRAIKPKQRERYQRAYDMFIEHAPELQDLINNPKKRNELRDVLKGMKKAMASVRSDDCARLKERIGGYVPANPGKDIISPPINNGQSTRSHLGFNHPTLARFLCPILHLQDYDDDPEGIRQKLLNSKIKVTSSVFPAFIWEGEPAGIHFDEDNMLDGMFRGYFLTRVMRHIFRGASSAFGEEPTGSRACNADLHDMTKIVAANIAYGALQARFGIASKNRWSEKDGKFNYRRFYYNSLDTIEDTDDKEWMDALLRFYNRVIFGSENGREDTDSTDSDEDSGSEDSFLARLRAQGEARALAARLMPPTNAVSANSDDAGIDVRDGTRTGSEANDGNVVTGPIDANTTAGDGGKATKARDATKDSDARTTASSSSEQPVVPPRFASLSNDASGSVRAAPSTPVASPPQSPHPLEDRSNRAPLSWSAYNLQLLDQVTSELSEEEDAKVTTPDPRKKGKEKARQIYSSDEEIVKPPKKQRKAPRKKRSRK